jgi:hypothetical protein
MQRIGTFILAGGLGIAPSALHQKSLGCFEPALPLVLGGSPDVLHFNWLEKLCYLYQVLPVLICAAVLTMNERRPPLRLFAKKWRQEKKWRETEK